jgi:hypothetical protein
MKQHMKNIINNKKLFINQNDKLKEKTTQIINKDNNPKMFLK